MPEYTEKLSIAENAVQRTLEKAIIYDNLDYSAELFQFGFESMGLLSEELSAYSDWVNPCDIWLKIEGDEIVELLLKTERTLVYAGIFRRNEVIYLLVDYSTQEGWYERYTERPPGW